MPSAEIPVARTGKKRDPLRLETEMLALSAIVTRLPGRPDAHASIRIRPFKLVLENRPVLSVNSNLLSCVSLANIEGIPQSSTTRLAFQLFIHKFPWMRLQRDRACFRKSDLGMFRELLACERVRSDTCHQ